MSCCPIHLKCRQLLLPLFLILRDRGGYISCLSSLFRRYSGWGGYLESSSACIRATVCAYELSIWLISYTYICRVMHSHKREDRINCVEVHDPKFSSFPSPSLSFSFSNHHNVPTYNNINPTPTLTRPTTTYSIHLLPITPILNILPTLRIPFETKCQT
jgi:hypothetical protein